MVICLVVFGNSCEFFLRFTRPGTSTFQGNVFFTFHLPHPKRFFYVSCCAMKRFFTFQGVRGKTFFLRFSLRGTGGYPRARDQGQWSVPTVIICLVADSAGPLPKGTVQGPCPKGPLPSGTGPKKFGEMPPRLGYP